MNFQWLFLNAVSDPMGSGEPERSHHTLPDLRAAKCSPLCLPMIIDLACLTMSCRRIFCHWTRQATASRQCRLTLGNAGRLMYRPLGATAMKVVEHSRTDGICSWRDALAARNLAGAQALMTTRSTFSKKAEHAERIAIHSLGRQQFR